MKGFLTILLYSVLYCTSLFSQSNTEKISSALSGYWEGAFIKNNSYQKFDMQFYERDSKVVSLQIIEEWNPTFGEFELPVEIDSLGNISFNTAYGKAKVYLDTNSLEIIGQLENSLPTTYLNLKKAPQPSNAHYSVEAVTIKNGEVDLAGHLHSPNFGDKKVAVIIVGGRSCYSGTTKYDLYAKMLRDYGVSVVAYNKRGTGKSTGDCTNATITNLASDVAAIKTYLENHPNAYEKIGVIGSSAGGWVMTKALEYTNFDFMISSVGPSTSVKEQQLQSMDYGLDSYNLSKTARENLLKYTNMMFDAPATEESYEQFQELLTIAKTENWFQLLEDTDVPASIEGIDNLWVRRHNFDPNTTLPKYRNPFLAIYGEKDWVVPYKENIQRLKEQFGAESDQLLNTVVAHEAGHGLEAPDKYITLSDEKSYWRFFRIAPSVRVEIIDFLKKYRFIE